MSKPKTKQELLQLISKTDILEFDIEIVNRKDSPSAKKSKEGVFSKSVQSAVKSERDIILLAVKAR